MVLTSVHLRGRFEHAEHYPAVSDAYHRTTIAAGVVGLNAQLGGSEFNC
jgi:hypothetical protein